MLVRDVRFYLRLSPTTMPPVLDASTKGRCSGHRVPQVRYFSASLRAATMTRRLCCM